MSLVFVDKGKTAKEEARELLLKEEAAVRDKVRGIQDNLSLMLRALGEMAISNPVFAHSQLPSLVRVMQPAFLCVLLLLMYRQTGDISQALCQNVTVLLLLTLFYAKIKMFDAKLQHKLLLVYSSLKWSL